MLVVCVVYCQHRGKSFEVLGRKCSNTLNLAPVTSRFLFYERDQEVYAVFNHIIIGNKG